MLDLAPPTLLIVALVFTLAGMVKGVIGLGLPTVAMGLLSLFIPPAEAAAILLLPSFVTNVWQLAAGPDVRGLIARLWPTLLAVFAATVAAAGLITGGNAALVAVGLGAALVVYAMLGLMKVKLLVPPRAERWAGPLAGAATGLVTGATGMFVVPAVPYLNGLGLPRDDLIQALGLSFTVSTMALAAGLLWHGAVDAPALGASVIAIAPALAGMWLGGWVRKRVEQDAFRRWFFVGLAVLGAQIAWKAVAVGSRQVIDERNRGALSSAEAYHPGQATR